MITLRIAQAQINPTVGDFAANAALIDDFLRQARQQGAHLAVFPELAVCGYPPEDLLHKPQFLADNQRWLERVAQGAQGITAVVGYAEEQGGQVYNSAAVLGQGRVLASYRKIELPNYEVFDEKRYFAPGQGCLILEMGGTRVLLSVCEDIWVPDGASESAAQANQAQLTVNISGSPFHAGKLEIRRQMLARYAGRTGHLVCYCNMVGGQDELVFDGGSLIMDPQGRVLALAKRFEQDLLVCDLEVDPSAVPGRPGSPPLPQGPDRLLILPTPEAPAGAAAPCTMAPDTGPEQEVYQALVLGTGDYVRKNGFKKVVLGLSGGIDSSLTAAIAVEALGADNVVGVTMPSQYTSGETRSDAEALAHNLGIRIITVPIKAVLAAYLAELAPALGPGPGGVTEENLQARIRGNILMALSNRYGWLVLTTGNKSETAVGYCTLYGDMAGGFAVIKDVPKTLVYRLSDYLNQRAGRALIPQSVVDRPPSAELRPDQKDEDSLPPYHVLDPILQAYVEQDKAMEDIAAQGFDPRTVKDVVRLVDLNEYKRRQAPPGVKITPKAFGRDRRLPITNHYRPGWA